MKITATGNGPSPSGRTTNVVMSPSAVPTRISFSIISSSLTVADAIVQMDHAVLEAAFVHQLEVHAQIVGQGLVAASHHDGRHLIHPASVHVRASRPLEVVDEGMDLLVRRSPIEVAVLVRNVAVERGDRRIDQPGHRTLRSV